MSGSYLGWGTITLAGDESRFVVVPGERDERGSELFDRIEGTPLPWGSRTKDGEASIPKHSISSWKSPDGEHQRIRIYQSVLTVFSQSIVEAIRSIDTR